MPAVPTVRIKRHPTAIKTPQKCVHPSRLNGRDRPAVSKTETRLLASADGVIMCPTGVINTPTVRDSSASLGANSGGAVNRIS